MRIKTGTLLLGTALASALSGTSLATDFAQSPAADRIPAHVTLPEGAMAGYYFALNLRSLQSRRLSLLLPEQSSIALQGRLRQQHPNGTQVWQGSVEGEPDSSAIITQHGKAFAGVVRFGGRLFKVQQVADEIHMLMEVSPNEPYPEDAPLEADTFSPQGSSSTAATDQASDDGSQIDVMVVYSTDTKTRYGGVDGVNAHIALAIAESNQAYQNSQISTQLRLVHTAEVINSLGDSGSDLVALRSTTDGIMDEVHTLRDQYGADMVSWFSEVPGVCGRAYVNTGTIANSAAYGFSVVNSGCATGYYSTAHELGHNMGSTHNKEANPGTPIYTYSYGYQDPGEVFRTIMAYNCTGGCIRQQFFSNPDLTFNGLITGILNEADNARSINQTRTPVSLWRTAVVGAVPDASFSYSCNLLVCSFSDTSTASNPLSQWQWSFGDGEVSTEQSPEHTFASAGQYNVQLTVTDDTGASDFVIVPVDVSSAPQLPPVQPTLGVNVNGAVVEMSWVVDSNATRYSLEREKLHPKNGRWTSLTLIDDVTSPYQEQPGSGTYQYRLTAHNAFGSSEPSDWQIAQDVTDASGSGGGGKGGKGGGKK